MFSMVPFSLCWSLIKTCVRFVSDNISWIVAKNVCDLVARLTFKQQNHKVSGTNSDCIFHPCEKFHLWSVRQKLKTRRKTSTCSICRKFEFEFSSCALCGGDRSLETSKNRNESNFNCPIDVQLTDFKWKWWKSVVEETKQRIFHFHFIEFSLKFNSILFVIL